MWKPTPLRNEVEQLIVVLRTLLTSRARDQENRLQAGILKGPVQLCLVALKPDASCTPAFQILTQVRLQV